MPTPSDSIDMEQLRARLDAIYEQTPETADANPRPAHQSNAYHPQQNAIDVAQLTKEAQSYSPDNAVEAKAHRVATIGTYIDSLRTHKLRGQ